MTTEPDDILWSRVTDLIRAEGMDPDAMLKQAADNLSHYRQNPHAPTEAEISGMVDFILYGGSL
jgi:hypothetical protein